MPITEDMPQNPINPYGASKLMVEHIMEDYHKAYGLNYCCLRYFNAAGADPEGEIGETIKFMTALTFKHVPFKTVSYPRDPAGLKLPKFFSRL